MFAEFPHSDTESCTFRRIGLYFCFFIAIYDDYNIVNNTCQQFSNLFKKKIKVSNNKLFLTLLTKQNFCKSELGRLRLPSKQS